MTSTVVLHLAGDAEALLEVVRPEVERSFSLDDAPAALQEFGRGKRGKLGISID